MSIFDIEDGCNKNMEQIIYEEMGKIVTRTTKTKWTDSKYENLKTSSMTMKGDFGESVTSKMYNNIDGFKSEVVNKGIGEFDILLTCGNGVTWRIEHKLATEDTSNSFQFNGIKKDVNYDFVFCMGVSPNDLYFHILTKEEAQHLTTMMAKGVAGTYKYTKTKNSMLEYTEKNFWEVNKKSLVRY